MRVLICRPEPFASELKTLLANSNIAADVWPALHISPPSDDSLKHFCQKVAPGDIVIAVSQFAISQGLINIPETTRATLQRCSLFAVGAATAKAMQTIGLHHVQHPDKADSEHLLALPELQDCRGKRVWLLRGQSGRELIADTLRQRGASVEAVCCYARRYNTDQVALLALFKQPLQLILLTSLDSLKAFWAQIPTSLRSDITQIPITSMNPRMRDLANDVGFATIRELTTADNRALAAWIAGDKHGRPTDP